MILTREQAIELHRDMWNWIADEVEKIKKVVDIWKYKENYCKANGYIRVKHFCFLCEYTRGECSLCPLDWESEAFAYMCEKKDDYDKNHGGLWLRCLDAETWEEQATFARKIANLTERKSVL